MEPKAWMADPQSVNRRLARRQLHRLVRGERWQHAGREPNRLRNHLTHRHSSAWNQNSGESATKKQRVAQNALAREVGLPPRVRSRTGQQLTLPPLAEAPVQATTDVTGRHDPRTRSERKHSHI